ncbi:hypothetical protein QBC38DRAFT_542417 [Podospora fimiseda]|uniref:DUF6589 domain-containing protein n=1 Tax=Podospora fimiseda TaxID=252190 RepID=A0AAN7H485_9PEZI|nr:hypothetical protein QBC38DRAFT_542417 [Podospora fimiseda]
MSNSGAQDEPAVLRASSEPHGNQAENENEAGPNAGYSLPPHLLSEVTQLFQNLETRNERAVERGEDTKHVYNFESLISVYLENTTTAGVVSRTIDNPAIKEKLSSLEICSELELLKNDPSFAAFNPRAYHKTQQRPPTTAAELFSQLLHNQDKNEDDIKAVTFDEKKQKEIYFLVSSLFNGSRSFLRDILGLYLIANDGTGSRAVIETLNHLGIIPSYTTLNGMLNQTAEDAKKIIKAVFNSPDCFYVCSNASYNKDMMRTPILEGRGKNMVNLAICAQVSNPELNGPFFQSDIDRSVDLTVEMIIQYFLPRRDPYRNASKWLTKHAFNKLFKRLIPPMPTVKRATFKETSPYLPLGAMLRETNPPNPFDSHVNDVYDLHHMLKERFGLSHNYPWLGDRLIFVHGDQKTTSSIRYMQAGQMESSSLFEQKKWMLPVPGFGTLNSTTLKCCLTRYGIHPRAIPGHRPLSRRIFTTFTAARSKSMNLEDSSISGKPSSPEMTGPVNTLTRTQSTLNSETTVDFFKQSRCFSSFTKPPHPDPSATFLWWRTHKKSKAYGREMLYFSWILHPDVAKADGLADAILKSYLVNTGNGYYMPVDLMHEHINASYTVKTNNNDEADRLALNAHYLSTIPLQGRYTKRKRNNDNDSTTTHLAVFNSPDIYMAGQEGLLDYMEHFNHSIVLTKDDLPHPPIQRRFAGTVDGVVDYFEEGDRLYGAEKDLWTLMVGDE